VAEIKHRDFGGLERWSGVMGKGGPVLQCWTTEGRVPFTDFVCSQFPTTSNETNSGERKQGGIDRASGKGKKQRLSSILMRRTEADKQIGNTHGLVIRFGPQGTRRLCMVGDGRSGEAQHTFSHREWGEGG